MKLNTTARMDVQLIGRYRKHLEFCLWTIIIALGVFLNVINLPGTTDTKGILNVLIGVFAVYTFFYYRILAPRHETRATILFSTLFYTLLVVISIHFSGSFDSVIFALAFVPILVSMMLLGLRVVFVVGTFGLLALLAEFFLFYLPMHQGDPTAFRIIFDRMLALVLVTYITYINTREILDRAQENQALRKEKDEIRDLKEREETIFQSIQDMVIALDKAGMIILCNSSFSQALGEDRKEIIGKHYRDVFNIFEIDHLGNLIAEIDLLLTEEFSLFFTKPEGDQEKDVKLVVKKNQKEIYIELTNSPLTDDQKQIEGAVVVMRDVTEKKQLDRMKLDFVSMAAHELRTPITAVRGYLSALKEEAWTILNDEQKRFVDRADIASVQLATLMENLLSVSRIERGSYNLDRRETDWNHLIEQRTEEFQTRAEAHGLGLVLKPPIGVIPHVWVDPLRITEVFNNLVSNAINYTNEGKVEIQVEYDPKEEMVITHIQDTGQGIPAEAISHMFEKFFRVSGVLEQGSKGTGLGLYISKQITELHGGKIWVQSQIDVGSKFSFSIPTMNNKIVEQTASQNTLRQGYHGQKPVKS